MERMHGTPVTQVDALRAQGVDIPKLARAGVEIFFTQVFRDGFFHADMHPGNILVTPDGQLHRARLRHHGHADRGRQELPRAELPRLLPPRLPARGQAHIESGWAPADTRVDEFEAAIRAVCEPIFDRPLKEISFGTRAAAPVPDLAPLQRRDPAAAGAAAEDAAQHRGPGARARPRLDLWQTAKPYLERWMSEQVGWRGLARARHGRRRRTGARCCRSCRAWCTRRSTRQARRRCSRRTRRTAAREARGRTGCSR